MRYQNMKAEEKQMMSSIILYAAGVRAVRSLEETEYPKYDLVLQICEAIEMSEESICTDSKMFGVAENLFLASDKYVF